jgi:[protein-PII] uridylyltransferase
MSLTAQKKDIHDPDIINDFARRVGDPRHLDYLYLLTVADIRATNPTLWNAWRASLLQQLYQSTQRALRRGLGNPIDKDELIQETQSEAFAVLLEQGFETTSIKNLWSGFGDDYFLRHSSDEIIWHTTAILQHPNSGRALVLAREDGAHGGTGIFIFAQDRPNLFALMTSTLDRLGLTVVDARIITSSCGYVLDSYAVLEGSGEPIDDPLRIQEIVDTLTRVLNSPEAEPATTSRHVPSILKHFPTPTQVSFSDDTGNVRTVMELITADRPGLLYRIGKAFTECDIRVQNAKIATIGARAEDVFFITDQDNQPLRTAARYNALRRSLVSYLEQPPD